MGRQQFLIDAGRVLRSAVGMMNASRSSQSWQHRFSEGSGYRVTQATVERRPQHGTLRRTENGTLKLSDDGHGGRVESSDAAFRPPGQVATSTTGQIPSPLAEVETHRLVDTKSEPN